MILNITELKESMSKISLAVEKSKINPKSGWIELETTNNSICFKVSNFNYYLEMTIPAVQLITDEEKFHATILAETFIPLISKLEEDEITICEQMNSLVVTTNSSSYTFPVIKELGITKVLDTIPFDSDQEPIEIDGNDLASVASINSNGLINAVFTKEIQQYIYVDNIGALTFTENIYVNTFKNPASTEFKMLLTITQSRLLGIFNNLNDVKIKFESKPTFSDKPTTTNKVCIFNDSIKLILITQNTDITNTFPSIRLRALSENPTQTHIVVDKKLLDKALARLMVFDKSFDIAVLDYSKLVFKQNELELVSIKNKNIEKIPYISSQNVVEHESIIRFADLIRQLKAITSKEIDISYGERPAIVINGNCKQLIPEIVTRV